MTVILIIRSDLINLLDYRLDMILNLTKIKFLPFGSSQPDVTIISKEICLECRTHRNIALIFYPGTVRVSCYARQGFKAIRQTIVSTLRGRRTIINSQKLICWSYHLKCCCIFEKIISFNYTLSRQPQFKRPKCQNNKLIYSNSRYFTY